MKKGSLKGRLVALIVVAIGCAQALVIGVTVWQEASRYAKTKKDVLLAEAHVLAAAVSKPAAARSPVKVYAALRAIGAIPDLTFVGVEDPSGRMMAELGAAEILGSDLKVDGGQAPLPVARLLVTRSVILHVPIVDGGFNVGQLVLISDARDLKERLWRTLSVSVLSLAASLLIAMLVAWRMQRSVTRPLDELTEAMQSVASQHDYSLSLRSSGVREVAILVDGFNAMLGEIRVRDARIASNYADLERQVADRTADLSIAKDAAESANAQKSDFLATMSHEIRTPMNGMLVMAELLAHSQLPARAQRYADVIWRSGQGLLAIINDVLDFSKIEAGKLELEKVPTDLAEIAGTIMDLFSEKARSKGLDLATRVAIDVPRLVLGDPVRLNQVLSNLVNNALKFTESGGVLVDIAMDPLASDVLRFSVIDTGIGIAPEKLGSVFGAFSQADQSTTRRYGGTGLGLTICRKLVEAMGSEIELQSTLGEGSIFSFATALPLVEEPGQVQGPPAAACPGSVRLSVSRPMTSRAVAYYLGQAGYEIEDETRIELPHAIDACCAIVVDAGQCSRDLYESARTKDCRVIALVDRGTQMPEQLEADLILSWPVSRRDADELLSSLATGYSLVDDKASRLDVRDHYDDVRALVADDNEVNREVASEALGRLGVSVDLVDDGQAAVSAAASRRYDVIFMDGSMPILDGFSATRQIRTVEQAAKLPRTPIVALTAHVLGTSSTEWVDAGMDAVLSKPFTLAALAKCLSSVLRHDRMATSQGEQEAEPPSAAPSSDDLVDAGTIAELMKMATSGRSDFVERVVGLYIDRAPKLLNDIRVDAAEGRSQAAAKSAHALKSMSLNLGATRVAQLAAEIEAAATKSSLPAHAVLQLLASAIGQTCTQLQTHVPAARRVA